MPARSPPVSLVHTYQLLTLLLCLRVRTEVPGIPIVLLRPGKFGAASLGQHNQSSNYAAGRGGTCELHLRVVLLVRVALMHLAEWTFR